MIATTDDLFLGGKVRIRQPAKGYRAGLDPVLLAAAVDAKAGQSVLELGMGVGTALVCLGARVPGLTLAGVEIQPELAALACENVSRAGLIADVITSDLKELPSEIRSRTFDHVIANPPYFQRHRGSSSDLVSRETSRREATPIAHWIDVATRRLAPKGILTLIQRANRLGDVLDSCDDRLGSFVIRPIASRIGRDAEFVEFVKEDGFKQSRGRFAALISAEKDDAMVTEIH